MAMKIGQEGWPRAFLNKSPMASIISWDYCWKYATFKELIVSVMTPGASRSEFKKVALK